MPTYIYEKARNWSIITSKNVSECSYIYYVDKADLFQNSRV